MSNNNCDIYTLNEEDMNIYSGEFTNKLFEHETFVVSLIMLTYKS